MSIECSSMRADETAACERILAASFERAAPLESAQGPESDVIVLREAGVVRGLVIVRDRRAGFGGSFVRAACLSSLCVSERERERGLGTVLVDHALRAACARKAATAILIPRSEDLYARLGFARGGVRFACTFDLPRRPALAAPTRVRPFERSDLEAWLELAESAARERTGCVIPTAGDRARRARAPRLAYVVERAGRVVASITLSERFEPEGSTLFVHELLALDRDACDAAWAHVAGFATRVRRLRWRAAPTDPLAEFAHAAGARFETRGSWMLRLVDARRFLAERGYAREQSGEFVFALEDPCLSANEPPFTLAVEVGRGLVREGGRDALRLDCASAASLFGGVTPASRLSALGRLKAPASALERLDAVFGLPPSMMQSLP